MPISFFSNAASKRTLEIASKQVSIPESPKLTGRLVRDLAHERGDLLLVDGRRSGARAEAGERGGCRHERVIRVEVAVVAGGVVHVQEELGEVGGSEVGGNGTRGTCGKGMRAH